MNQSPVQFARDFARLKSDLNRSPALDHKLLTLMAFWPQLEAILEEPAFRSYVDEYLPLLLHCTSAESLFDFSIAELTALKDALARLQVWTKGKQIDEQVAQKARLVTFRLATVLLYVGSIEDTLPLVASLAGEKRAPKFDSDRFEGLGSFEALRTLIDDITAASPAVGRILRDIFERWEAESDCVHHDQIWCLFVEKNERGRVERGRLKTLHGTVEALCQGKKRDVVSVSFDNQIRTPDDPFVGVAYHALEAVRTVLESAGVGWRKDTRALRAFLSIPDSKQTFTGDSIGLAVGLVSYTQLLKPYVLRQERFIVSEAAVTGGVDARGRLVAVNESTLACKVERAFFSHVKFLVLPEANLEVAKNHLASLNARFPRRRLRLIGVKWLDEVVENRNIVRSEKVCMGTYVTRTAIKYSRATKVQVPLLIAMLYALTCIIYPKAWIGFDWNPEYVTVDTHGFTAFNKDSVPLWSHMYDLGELTLGSPWSVGDIDSDGDNEVLFALTTTTINEENAALYVYDYSGRLLWRRHCVILNQFPGDTTLLQSYDASCIEFVSSGDSTIIITRINQCFPARTHIKFWNAWGDSLGWYVNGGCGGRIQGMTLDYNDSTYLWICINNRAGCASLMALRKNGSYGVSPPNLGVVLDSCFVTPGNQFAYILFPRTDVTMNENLRYNHPGEIRFGIDSTLKIVVNEGESSKNYGVFYYLNSDLRVAEVRVSDGFISRRETLVDDSVLPPVQGPTYKARLLDAVTYWTDSGWVTEGELRAAEER